MLLGAVFRLWDLILIVVLILLTIGIVKIKNATEETARKLDEITNLLKKNDKS